MSDTLLSLLAPAALKGSVVCAGALLLAVLFRRAAPATRHLVLLGAIASFLVVPMVGLLLPSLAVRSPIPVAQPATPANAPQASLVGPMPSDARISVEAGPAAAAPRVDWRALMIAAWAAGALLLLVRLVIASAAVRRMLLHARPVDEPQRSRGRLAAAGILRTRKPRILQSPLCTVPLTIGTLRPLVMLPVSLAADTGTPFDAVMAHELAHARRCDALSSRIAYFVCSLFWFVPLAWLVLSRLRVEQEKACDEAALGVYADRTRYAELLVRLGAAAHRPVFLAAHAAGVRTLEERIRSIVGPRSSRARPRRFVRSALALGAAAVLVPLSMMRCAPAPAPVAQTPTVPAQTAAVPEVRFQLQWKSGHMTLPPDHTLTTYDYPVFWPLGPATSGASTVRQGTVTRVIGAMRDPLTGRMVEHGGIEINGAAGWAVLATGSGVVASTGYNSEYGNYVVIKHPTGFQSTYGLLQGPATLHRGDPVAARQRIGVVGGMLRFALSLNGQSVDPQEVLNATLGTIAIPDSPPRQTKESTMVTTETFKGTGFPDSPPRQTKESTMVTTETFKGTGFNP